MSQLSIELLQEHLKVSKTHHEKLNSVGDVHEPNWRLVPPCNDRIAQCFPSENESHDVSRARIQGRPEANTSFPAVEDGVDVRRLINAEDDKLVKMMLAIVVVTTM